MPYIIYVPGVPKPYITNDPRIYMDCLKIFKWECESRPFSDTFCKALREKENDRFLSDRRRSQLEAYWVKELERQTTSEKGLHTLEESITLSTCATIEKLVDRNIETSVLSEIKDHKEGAP
jgi:hypothetical protein